MDITYIAAGLTVPVTTFVGLSLWRLRARAAGPPRHTAGTDAKLVQSVAAMHDRLDELGHQISELGEDWETRDRELAERLIGLISLRENAPGSGRGAPSAPSAGAAGDIDAPGDIRRGGG